MWKVMQTLETGEVMCAQEFETADEAFHWIDTHEHQYPESTFFVEESRPEANFWLG